MFSVFHSTIPAVNVEYVSSVEYVPVYIYKKEWRCPRDLVFKRITKLFFYIALLTEKGCTEDSAKSVRFFMVPWILLWSDSEYLLDNAVNQPLPRLRGPLRPLKQCDDFMLDRLDLRLRDESDLQTVEIKTIFERDDGKDSSDMFRGIRGLELVRFADMQIVQSFHGDFLSHKESNSPVQIVVICDWVDLRSKKRKNLFIKWNCS